MKDVLFQVMLESLGDHISCWKNTDRSVFLTNSPPAPWPFPLATAYLTHNKRNVPSSLCISLPGSLTVGLVQQCQTIHGRDRNCIPPQLPPEWITTLFFIIMGVVSLTATCVLMVMSRWRREATRYARWIAFTGSRCSLLPLLLLRSSF